ncbi:hypothetical protein BRC19_00115 [Candidatus Saccharibacteria bacterium QS_5_54_17]|nr:MAG: hypothetical protein BRC19_00115 [Candidatus Saccharibacteria bacterium QS_5_54_17]
MKQLLGNKRNTTLNDLIDTYYQERFLRVLLLLLIAVVLGQTLYYSFTEYFGGALFNVWIVVSLWVAVWTLHKNYYQLASSLTILASLALLVFSVLVSGLSDATIFWFFVFPVVATFLKGKRGGSIWLLTVVLILVSIYVASQTGMIATIEIEYNAATFQQLIAAIFLVAIFVYVYQDNLDRKAASVAEREEKLNTIYTQLQDEIAHRQSVADSLNQNVQTLQRQKARIEALLDSIGEGVIAVDQEGKIIMANHMTKQLFNYYEDDIIGQYYSDVFALYDTDDNPVPAKEHPLMQALHNQTHYHTAEYFFHDYNDEPVPVSTTATPVNSEDENIGAIEVFRDISEERAVAKAKDEFLSLASHQLRTPLGAIRWYTERLLKASQIKGKNRSYLETIYEDSARMSSLLSDYLNISRLELGRGEISVSEVAFGDVVAKTLNDAQPLIDEKQLAISQNFSQDLTLQTDEQSLELILQNLISNAVKYTPERGTVTITAGPYTGDKKSLQPGTVFHVEDSGMGIPLDQQRNIFTKLFRADNAQHSNIEGTGLGLYSVKATVDNLGGMIWFESQPERGSSFAVILPDLESGTMRQKEN